ncbi:MAG: adenosine deaminase [Proteobacteria bacterium]|nr:adenosine deaminase [Pseudomonadota bacterium]
MADLDTLVAGMPKAELHMHLEGSLEAELTFALAARNGVTMPYASVEALRRAYAFTNLQSFLDLYYAGVNVLLQPQDFYDLTWAYFARAKQDNVVHAELFLGPQGHTARNIPMATVFDGVLRALDDVEQKLGITSRLIMVFQRHQTEDDGFRCLEASAPWHKRIAGVGLGGAEIGHPPQKFARLFAECTKRGFRKVAHAGEEGPAEFVVEALDVLGVERIDHGVRAEEDPALVARLAKSLVPLTVCPISNVKLKVFPDLAHHNVKRLLRAGLCVTINSDDPSYFGGYVNDNLIGCRRALDLTRDDVYRLARNSFVASFLSDADKARHIRQLDDYWTSV